MSKLQKMLIRHEGLRLKPYRDTTGTLTIGVGHNLDDNGITEEVAMIVLQLDIASAMIELFAAFPWMSTLSCTRQDVLIDMAFNLGMPRLKKFKKMLAAVSAGDFVVASAEMLDSKWAVQVGDRAKELAEMMLTGEYRNER